ncbi:hypothetical protein P3T37_002335 [Kitasatospora sp. MAA4]|uniref:hypothetical protein n=1 Tax=Kitasatospora sp. MAA4 TaxID=3035093 RepID=UPI002474409F|nr:hypothetical protein [Kitasatospora sp. MAA4]MDH6132949.1 hypothetical protein [Kitasatospora sp. MAA4]
MNAGQRPEPVERAELLGQVPVPAERDLPAGRHALHRERLMRQIDLDLDTPIPTPAPARPRFRRRLAVTLAGALVVGTAVAVVATQSSRGGGSGPLSSAELASWTGVPAPLAASTGPGAIAEKWCLDRMTAGPGAGAPVTITNADLRGKVASMIVNRGGNAMLCYVASETSGLWEAIDPVKPVAPDAVTDDTGGSHGDGDATFNYAQGSVGADVKAITMQVAGRTFQVTVADGRWTAWWPGSTSHAGVPDTVTVTLSDGTTRIVSGSSLIAR